MKISIIGAGNMAHQLGHALYSSNHTIIEIYNRSYRKGSTLAKNLGGEPVKRIDQLNVDIDLLIIAISDDAINDVSGELDAKTWADVLIVHTSGSVSSEVLNKHRQLGVFYPFQSMTAGQDIDFRPVPILVFSNSNDGLRLLIRVAESISDNVHLVSDDQRGVIHIAGVFANNFSNHMMALADGILAKNALSFDILKPLIMNTLHKVLKLDPRDAQTGPAVRRDGAIIEKHLSFLEDQPELKTLYSLISESIIKLDESGNS